MFYLQLENPTSRFLRAGFCPSPNIVQKRKNFDLKKEIFSSAFFFVDVTLTFS